MAPATTQGQSIFTVVQLPTAITGRSTTLCKPRGGFVPFRYMGCGPMINGDNASYLDGVVDISPSEAWAAGIVGIGTATPGQIIERWDGAQWSVFPGPAFSSGEPPSSYGMTAVSANSIATVGAMLVNNQNLEVLFEHWDGTAWTAHTGTFYGFFLGGLAGAANDVWAVGYSGLNFVTFSEPYDGTSWKLVRTPNAGTGPNVLNAVVALAPNDVWAVGYFTAG